MGAKSVKTRPQLVFKPSIAEKMTLRDNNGAKLRSGSSRKLTSHFDSNGELSGIFTPAESPRTENPNEVANPAKTQDFDNRKPTFDRGKVVAIEIKAGKGRFQGLKRLGTRSQEQSCIETKSVGFKPIPSPQKSKIGKTPRVSDFQMSPRSGGVYSNESEKKQTTEAAIKDLFVTGYCNQGKNTAVTFRKSLLRKKPLEKKPKVSINFNPPRVRSGLVSLLHEAVNVEGEIGRAQRRGSTRGVNNLVSNRAELGVFQQHIEFFNAGLLGKSDGKTMYLPRAAHSPPTSPKILRLFVSKNDSDTLKSRAEQKWKWMGSYGTADGD